MASSSSNPTLPPTLALKLAQSENMSQRATYLISELLAIHPYSWTPNGSRTPALPLQSNPHFTEADFSSKMRLAQVHAPSPSRYLQTEWSLSYSNSRRHFQYTGQFDPSPSPRFKTPSHEFYSDHHPLKGPGPRYDLAYDDFTRQPQRWNCYRPHLPYVFRLVNDPELPSDPDFVHDHNQIYFSPSYISHVLNFIEAPRRSTLRWEKVLQDCGLPIPLIPSAPYSSTKSQSDLKSKFKEAGPKIELEDRACAYLKFGYECRGYAQWALRRFITHLASVLSHPPPLFGVDERQVGTVLRASDCHLGFHVWEELERDGVPLFGVELHHVHHEGLSEEEAGFSGLSHPHHHLLYIRRQYEGGKATRHPAIWFVHGHLNLPDYEQDSLYIFKLLGPDIFTKANYPHIWLTLKNLYGPGPFQQGPLVDSILCNPALGSRSNMIDFSTLDPPSLLPLQKWSPTSTAALSPPNLYSNPDSEYNAHYVQTKLQALYHMSPQERPPHLPLNMGDFQKLRTNSWLNDEIINSYVHILQNASPPTVYIHDTYFFLKLLSPSLSPWHSYPPAYKNVIHRPFFVNMERIIFPVHVHNNHWVVNCVDFKTRTVTFFDSMHSERTKNDVFRGTSHYLQNLAALEGHVSFSIKDWVFDGSPENASSYLTQLFKISY
ncbi:hypothetical protein BS47DRAFT_1392852 [Hydnum rufescens UP504]|uniref:Ubiquitin-like protease family profile domain-containing protein n=1 Tax=Hydnum rufescens UP504 TaxID=1448309 RepID=A0A9P6AY05_9AGAM|nr:hypothetical protein BS47DRAFT_1392852 [Hydnum rufescens UP504]